MLLQPPELRQPETPPADAGGSPEPTCIGIGHDRVGVPVRFIKAMAAAERSAYTSGRTCSMCFDTRCAAKGDAINLWAALHKKEVRAAALELVQTFHLEPAPRTPTPHRPRHG